MFVNAGTEIIITSSETPGRGKVILISNQHNFVASIQYWRQCQLKPRMENYLKTRDKNNIPSGNEIDTETLYAQSMGIILDIWNVLYISLSVDLVKIISQNAPN